MSDPGGLVLDPRTRVLDGGRTVLGGDPWRMLRLTEGGAAVLQGLLAGPAAGGHGSAGARTLARRLVDAGLAHPRPTRAATDAVTVLIPVRDRPAELARCLTGLLAGDGAPGHVVVVDDGSLDPDAVAAVCARHGVELIRRERPGGPAAARNTGLARIESGLVAMLDCDCAPEPGWMSLLCGALAADPGLGAVAPRVRPLRQAGAVPLARFAAVRSPLDLGPAPSLVRPGGRIAYVPTAALLARREALGESAFDPALRYGEDVDLVWRMLTRGWSIRYEPAAVVRHGEPRRVGAWLARRFHYGRSAGPLARRHPDHLAPMVLHPRSATALVTATAAAARRRPGLATAAIALHLGLTVRTLGSHGVPPAAGATLALRGLTESAAALGRAATMFGPEPLVLALSQRHVRRVVVSLTGRPPVRRAAVALLLASPLHEQVRRRPPLDPVRFVALALADDVAYGAGVWTGALQARTWRPLRPRLAR